MKRDKADRAEKSRANKAAFAEAQQLARGKVVSLDDYREVQCLPPGMVNGHTLRRRRGDATDEYCIDVVCELIARGMTCRAARELIGVPVATWHRWVQANKHSAREKYEFAKQINLENRADEIFDIVDAPLELPILDENGKEAKFDAEGKPIQQPLPPEVQLRQREHRVRAREWFLERLAAQFAPKSVNVTANIFQEIKTAATPQEAMAKYIEYCDSTRPE